MHAVNISMLHTQCQQHTVCLRLVEVHRKRALNYSYISLLSDSKLERMWQCKVLLMLLWQCRVLAVCKYQINGDISGSLKQKRRWTKRFCKCCNLCGLLLTGRLTGGKEKMGEWGWGSGRSINIDNCSIDWLCLCIIMFVVGTKFAYVNWPLHRRYCENLAVDCRESVTLKRQAARIQRCI